MGFSASTHFSSMRHEQPEQAAAEAHVRRMHNWESAAGFLKTGGAFAVLSNLPKSVTSSMESGDDARNSTVKARLASLNATHVLALRRRLRTEESVTKELACWWSIARRSAPSRTPLANKEDYIATARRLRRVFVESWDEAEAQARFEACPHSLFSRHSRKRSLL